MGYGASYLRGDQEANNWLQIAGMAKVMGNEFENDSASRGAAALMRGESMPEGMSEGARNKAYLEAPRLEEGAVVQRKNEIMKQAEEMAKSSNTTPHNILMNPSDDWFKDAIGYKAYASLAKDVTEANINSGKALASTREINLKRFEDFDSKRTAVKDALARGDFKAAASGLEVISQENPIPYKLSGFDENTKTFELSTMDMDKGQLVKADQRVPMEEALKQVWDMTQQKYGAGALLGGLTAKDINIKSFANPTIYKGKDGGIFRAVTFINPNTLTDTTIQLRDSSGKTVGSFSDPSKLADMGLTPYDQKFEKGELDIANEKKQGRNLDRSYANLGVEGLIKRTELDDKRADLKWDEKKRAHDSSLWDDETTKTRNEATLSGYKIRDARNEEESKSLQERAGLLETALSGGGVYYGKQPKNKEDAGVVASYGVKEMKNAKAAIVRLLDMGIDKSMIPTIVSESMIRAADYISDDNAYADAMNKALAVATNKTPEEVELFGDHEFRSLPYEEQYQLVQARIADKEQKKKDAESASFAGKGNKTLSRIYSDIADEYAYLVTDRDRKINMFGSKGGLDDNALMNQAISRYADRLTDAQGSYYPNISAEDFRRKIALSVKDIQAKRASQAAKAKQLEKEEQKKKDARAAYRDSIAGY